VVEEEVEVSSMDQSKEESFGSEVRYSVYQASTALVVGIAARANIDLTPVLLMMIESGEGKADRQVAATPQNSVQLGGMECEQVAVQWKDGSEESALELREAG
jgi:hypothetical protein